MNKKLKLMVATGLASALSVSAASASVTFVFEGPDGAADKPVNLANVDDDNTCGALAVSGLDLCTIDAAEGFDYSKSNIDVTAVAYSGAVATTLIQDIQPNNSGLGAFSSGEGTSDDQIQARKNESLEFSFGGAVELLAIDFNRGDDVDCGAVGSANGEGPCGQFELFNGAISLGVFDAVDDLDLSTIIMGDIIGDVFTIVAKGFNGDVTANSGFAIGSITVAEVPLPGAAALLLSGLAGLGFASRRKARA